MKSSKSNTFCMAPWIHTYLGPAGERLLCCTFDEKPFDPNASIDEVWNSQYYKDIRKKMLNNEVIRGCERCPINQSHTYRHYWNQNYGHLYDDIIKNTSDTGHYNGLPITFDYRTSKCNFKCKMCNPIFSSAILKEMSKNGKFDIRWNEFDVEITNREKISEIEIYKLLDTGNILEMYWAGGEPLISDLHWQSLLYSIDNNYAKDITLRYSSNLSTIEYKKYQLRDLWVQFKKVELLASVDATSDIGEWIRTGFIFDKWIDNIKTIKDIPNLELSLMITNSLPSLIDLPNMNKLSDDLDVRINLQKCVGSNSLLQVQDYPLNVISPVIKKVRDKIIKQDYRNSEYILNWLDENYNADSNVDRITDKKNYLLEELEYLEKNRPHHNINFRKIIGEFPTLEEFIYET